MANKVVIETALNPSGVVRGTKEIQKEIDATIKAQSKLEAKMEKFGRLGGNENSKAYQGMIYDASALDNKLEELNAEMQKATITEQMNANAMSYVNDATKQCEKSFDKIRMSVKKSDKDFKKMINTILKYGFGIRSVYFLFRKLRSAVMEGFKNLAQFNDGANYVNESISNIMNSLTKLKNSVASALAPLLSVVAPILNSFIAMVQRAIEYIAIFFSALTGKSTYYKAKDVNDDYAKSLQGVGKSAKEAKKQLAGFYDLNTLGKSSDSGSGGGGGYSKTEAKDMFEEISLAGNKIAEIGQKARDMLAQIANSEQWANIKNKVSELVGRIKEIASIGFKFVLGATPSLLEGIVNTASGIMDSFDGVVDFLDGLAHGDWDKAWTGLKNVVAGAMTAIVASVSGINNAIREGLIQAGIDVDTAYKLFPEQWFEIREGSIADKIRNALYGKVGATEKTYSNMGNVKDYLGGKKIPHLASGTVVPRTASQFMAVLGDNNREAEVVSPLSTMKQAFKEAMAESGVGGGTTIKVVLEGDANGLFNVVRTEEQNYYDRTGNLAFLH